MNIPTAATAQSRDAIGAVRITAVRRAGPTGPAAIMTRAIGIGTAIAIAIEKAATGRPNVPPSRQSPRHGAKSRRRAPFQPRLCRKATRRPRIRLNAASRVADAAADAVAGVVVAAAHAA